MQSSDVYKILPYVEFGKMSDTQTQRFTTRFMQFGHQTLAFGNVYAIYIYIYIFIIYIVYILEIFLLYIVVVYMLYLAMFNFPSA
jgi:hypothetical protein